MAAASEAWVTLATNDSYALGVLVLAHSLKNVESTRPLVVMVSGQVSQSMRILLNEVCARVVDVEIIDSNDAVHLALLARPELGVTLTKLHCWTLTDYTKCVFLDADTLVVRNCDELFEREELSAAPDAGWPDCFNSGVFVYRPSMETFSALLTMACDEGSFDGGDQGLLNLYFADWAIREDNTRRLPFIYNMTHSASYFYRPAYKQYGKSVRIVHFIGSPKPWHQASDSAPSTSTGGSCNELAGHWWDIFNSKVRPQLSPAMVGLAGHLGEAGSSDVASGSTESQPAQPQPSKEEVEGRRREAWERGEIDYTGRDSFDNLMEKMQQTLLENKKK